MWEALFFTLAANKTCHSLFPHTPAEFPEPGLHNPALVSVVMLCCVAYTDQTHLCGNRRYGPQVSLPNESFSLLPTDWPFYASFYLSRWNLFKSAFGGFADFRLDSAFYCLRTYILLPRVANFLPEALCLLRPLLSVTSYQP